MAWIIDDVLRDDLIQVVSRDDANGVYQVRIGSLATVITFALASTPSGYIRCRQSHTIRTPLRYRTKQPGIGLRNTRTYDQGYALYRPLKVMLDEYRAAIRERHEPDEDWLVPQPADDD